MRGFFSKALEQLGIGDIDDDDEFDDEFDDNDFDDDQYQDDERQYRDQQKERRINGAVLKPLPQEQRDIRRPIAAKPVTSENLSVRQPSLRPAVQSKTSQPKVQIVTPFEFGDAKDIGDLVKNHTPVILNLVEVQSDLGRRMLDFCSGLIYALSGSMEKVANHVFLITPTDVELSPEEKIWPQDRGSH
ncbi:MAG: cell division protein SepF [Firmicutes bacterium]|jgi:cell division inhibitor SepF|nr:cell division protein SepF [Bacillota bacterium]